MSDQTVSRRQFLTIAGIAGVGLGVAACGSSPASPAPATAMPTMDMSGAPSAQATPAEDMDAMHEAGVKAFVGNLDANNKVFWPQKLAFTMDGNTKVFNITTKEVEWTTRPG